MRKRARRAGPGRRAAASRGTARRARPAGAPRPRAEGRRKPGPARGGERDDTAIELRNIECQVHIGVDEAERAAPQRVVVDLALEGNMAGCDGERCGTLGDEVKRFLSGGRFVLIEATILKLARLMFRRTRARRVTVRLCKFVLPETDHVAIEMAFRRSEVRPSSSR